MAADFEGTGEVPVADAIVPREVAAVVGRPGGIATAAHDNLQTRIASQLR